MLLERNVIEFEWDKGNEEKNFQKHLVSSNEAEEAFFDKDKQEYPDPTHSESEIRKIMVGSTKLGRLLFVVYTKRKGKIRIISARDLNKRKERSLYEEAT
ncbi:MAG: BrnT family toxin [bacterium]|nr:BrnT family toxin [bacterium]